MSGYEWLIITSVTGLINGFYYAGAVYDALLHIVFVGFVFSMIFAHASVIIPSLSGKIIPWSRYFYLPFYLLHGSLILRIAGDFMGLFVVRAIGSWINVIAILLFLGGIVFRLIRGEKEKS